MGRDGGNVSCSTTQEHGNVGPLLFLVKHCQKRNCTQTYKIQLIFFFCTRARNAIQEKTSELCSQKLQENLKALQIAHKEGPPLPLKSAYQVYKICMEVRHMYDLIREYPSIWQVRQLHISCERKQFIDLKIFMNCFCNLIC